MPGLRGAHIGYEYQDLLIACRLVDVLLGTVVSASVDNKFFADDRFDDLTTVDDRGLRERVQFKHTKSSDLTLSLATFSSDARGLRLDKLIGSVLEDSSGPGRDAADHRYRVVLRDSRPTQQGFWRIAGDTDPDPGPFIPGLDTYRLQFNAEALLEEFESGSLDALKENVLAVLGQFDGEAKSILSWVCERLVLEVEAPEASGDLTAPGPAEQLLLSRTRSDVGADQYPNLHRSAVDVAEGLIRAARSARQGTLEVSGDELLRLTGLRNDFGAVSREHPVDRSVEVSRSDALHGLSEIVKAGRKEGRVINVVGPPGQGKSWLCKQLVDRLLADGWLVAEHYCYLGDADGERDARVMAETVFGTLVARLAENDPDLAAEQRPRFAADEGILVDFVARSISREPDRPIALVVDGIDHVTRVRAGGPGFDPSLALAEALGGLDLPMGSVLIVLSQPGEHLVPLHDAGAITVQVPGLQDDELRMLAVRHGLIPGEDNDSHRPAPLLAGDAAEEFLAVLAGRAAGNALYATYLCREALREPVTTSNPAAALQALPQFDGSLEKYYTHLYQAVGEEGGWVADIIAVVDFGVTRAELREIRLDAAHRIDAALSVLSPVIVERATQGVRIYHESFARFLRQGFQKDPQALGALLDHVIQWLGRRGIFEDPRAFRSLLPLLAEAGRMGEVVSEVDREFVVRGVASGFPASSIRSNLGTAIRCAGSLGNWPAVVRYVELGRSAETFQEERYVSTLVDFADVFLAVLGSDVVGDRLLHDNHPVMPARAGLQMCAAVDALGSAAPWHEYMIAFLRESENDNTSYGEASDRQVSLAWLRGRLRLSALASDVVSLASEANVLPAEEEAPSESSMEGPSNLTAPIDWQQLARWVEATSLPAGRLVDALLDTYGASGVFELCSHLSEPGDLYLALADRIDSGRSSDEIGSARLWATAAAAHGTSAGSAHLLLSKGIDVELIEAADVEASRERLIDLTRAVQEHSIQFQTEPLPRWLDACAVAGRRDALGLGTAEALIEGPGWYRCWLRFAVSLARAEAGDPSTRSELALEAVELLTDDLHPFTGDPRSCDLYNVHGLIDATIRRAVDLMNDSDWEKGLQILDEVSNSITTTLQGELGGPLPPDRLLKLAVETANPARRAIAETLIREEIESGAGGRYYEDLAQYRLIGARLALAVGDREEAPELWREACQLLVAYGWHKDTTIYEVLDPLEALITDAPAQSRVRLSALQPLCERIPMHTDGRETRYAREAWWKLLARADPVALSRLASSGLLLNSNMPDFLLSRALLELWRNARDQADPLVAGALRLSLDLALDPLDVLHLNRLADLADGEGNDVYSGLMTWLVARADERPLSYSVSNSKQLLEVDAQRVEEINSIARRAGIPEISPLLVTRDKEQSSGLRETHTASRPRPGQGEPLQVFSFDAAGLNRAIRAWRSRRYDDASSNWDVDRVANLFGYRLLELAQSGREREAATALEAIAEASGLGERPVVLTAVAEGLERNDQVHLAAIAHTLVWTRSRGGGGWLTFGGEIAIESLKRAMSLDPDSSLRILTNEVEHAVALSRYGTHGISQALIYALSVGALKVGSGSSVDIALEAWDEAFHVIASRAPRVHPSDDPEEPYSPENPDEAAETPGNLDGAVAIAALAGLAHPSREDKRRSLLAAQVLLEERPQDAAIAFSTALATVPDPGNLTWLLALLDDAGDRAEPIVEYCREVLSALALGPYLTVRALARRLLKEEIPLPPSSADSALLPAESDDIWTPSAPQSEEELATDDLINSSAGVRLELAEPLLPRLSEAVRRRVSTVLAEEWHGRRMKAQLNELMDSLERKWPDAYLAGEEAVEEALQRAAAGGRAARITQGLPLTDPEGWEDELATALLNDPTLPLAIERTRHPRPDIPLPPERDDPEWLALQAVADGASPADQGVEMAFRDGELILGTLFMHPLDTAQRIQSGRFREWRVLGSEEHRTSSSTYPKQKDRDRTTRYCAVEVRGNADRSGLEDPPLGASDVRAWLETLPVGISGIPSETSWPILGTIPRRRVPRDARNGLGIHTPLLGPLAWLISTLELVPDDPFLLRDETGPAIALLTWRGHYETSDYHLPWPRVRGAAIVVRGDALDRLSEITDDRLVLREYVVGSGGTSEQNEAPT